MRKFGIVNEYIFGLSMTRKAGYLGLEGGGGFKQYPFEVVMEAHT